MPLCEKRQTRPICRGNGQNSQPFNKPLSQINQSCFCCRIDNFNHSIYCEMNEMVRLVEMCSDGIQGNQHRAIIVMVLTVEFASGWSGKRAQQNNTQHNEWMLFLLLHQNRSLMSATAFGSWTLLSDFILLLHQKCQIAMVGMNAFGAPLFCCRISYDNGEYFSNASMKLYHNFFTPHALSLFIYELTSS